jgi:hypothetical protein
VVGFAQVREPYPEGGRKVKKLVKLALATAMLALTFAVPALAKSVGEDQYGNSEPPYSRGVITQVSGSSVTVEGSSFTCGAAILDLSEDTQLFFVRGGTVPATTEDLSVGQTVDVTYAVPEGPHTMECPQTYEALEIFILPYDGVAPPESS